MARPVEPKKKPRGDFIKSLRDEKRWRNSTLAKKITEALADIHKQRGQGGDPRECSEATLRPILASKPMPEYYFPALAHVFDVEEDELIERCDSTQESDFSPSDTVGKQKLQNACEGVLRGNTLVRQFILKTNELDECTTAAKLANTIFAERSQRTPLNYVAKCVHYPLPEADADQKLRLCQDLCVLADILTPASVSSAGIEDVQEYLASHRLRNADQANSERSNSTEIRTRYNLIAAATVASTKGFQVDAREERTFDELDASDNPGGVKKFGMLPPEAARTGSIVDSFAKGLARVLDPYDEGTDEENAVAFAQDALRSQAEDADVYFCVLFPSQMNPSPDEMTDLATAYPELVLLVSTSGEEEQRNITVLNEIKKIRRAFGAYEAKV